MTQSRIGGGDGGCGSGLIGATSTNTCKVQMYSPQTEQQAHAVLSGNVTIIKFQNIQIPQKQRYTRAVLGALCDGS